MVGVLTWVAAALVLQESARQAVDAGLTLAGSGSVVSLEGGPVAGQADRMDAPDGLVGAGAGALPSLAGWPFRSGVSAFDRASEMAMGDVDGDGQIEVVVVELSLFDTVSVFVFDAGGALEPGWPVSLPSYRLTHPVLGDVDGDGDDEIFFGPYGLQGDGSPLAGWPVVSEGCGLSSSNDLQVTGIVDLNEDGVPEVLGIFAQGVAVAPPCYRGARLHAWNPDGSDFHGFPVDMPRVRSGSTLSLRPPVVGDLDGDGDVEVVVAGMYKSAVVGDVADLHAFHHTGGPVAGWPRSLYEGAHEVWSEVHVPVVADLDRDGRSELVVSFGREAAGVEIHVLQGDGRPRAGWPLLLPAPVTTPVATSVGDLHGDQDLELVVTRSLADDQVETRVLRANGELVPGWPQRAQGYVLPSAVAVGYVYGSDWSEPILFDLRGDGRPEILHVLASTSVPRHEIFGWSADGRRLPGPLAILRGARRAGSLAIDDLDGDGRAEIGVVTQDGSRRTAVHFWRTGRPLGRVPWQSWGRDFKRSYRPR